MVSVIIPVYDAEKYLEECIMSVLNQTYRDVEVIIVDDGSNDNSRVIVRKIGQKDSRVRLIEQVNSGVSTARNTGIREANGEFVCFVDADDYIECTMIEKMIGAYSEDALVTTNFVHNDAKQLVLNEMWENYKIEGIDMLVSDYLIGNLGKSISFSVCNKLFELKKIKEYSILFPTGVKIGEDMIFVLQYLVRCNKVIAVNEGLYHYRIRTDSSMNDSGKDYLSEYCETLAALERMTYCEKLLLNSKVISRWSIEALIVLFTTRYVIEMDADEFKKYYEKIKSTSLYNYGVKCRIGRNWKRNILVGIIKTKNSALLRTIIILNKWGSSNA